MEDRAIYAVNRPSLRPETLLCFADPGYSHPTWEDVRLLVGLLGKTGEEIGLLVGVKSRTVRKWQASPDTSNHAEIPYSAWCVMLCAYRKSQEVPKGKSQ